MQEYKTKWQEAQRDLQAQLNTAKKVTYYILSFFLFYDHFTSQTLMHVKYYDHETGTFYHYLTCLCYKMI